MDVEIGDYAKKIPTIFSPLRRPFFVASTSIAQSSSRAFFCAEESGIFRDRITFSDPPMWVDCRAVVDVACCFQ